MNRIAAFSLAFATLVISGAASSHAADWPQWRGPQRDGISQEKGLLQQWPEGGPGAAAEGPRTRERAAEAGGGGTDARQADLERSHGGKLLGPERRRAACVVGARGVRASRLPHAWPAAIQMAWHTVGPSANGRRANACRVSDREMAGPARTRGQGSATQQSQP